METLDCLGKRCPLPIIEVAKKIADQAPGFKVLLLSDDPASAPDLVAWARMTGNSVEVIDQKTFEITKSTN
jgi:tRNA 2-thiouridine synthesizing protein A